MDEIIMGIWLLAVALVFMFWGFHIGRPTELPNGCILHDDNIYCLEEVSE